MSKELIDPIRRLERATLSIPIMKKHLENGSFSYIAGSLILNFKDPTYKSRSGLVDPNFTTLNVEPLENCGESELLREEQYLISKMYVKNKEKTCSYYEQALSNIEQYERIHGCDRSRQAQMQ